jgi:hypothetical protein
MKIAAMLRQGAAPGYVHCCSVGSYRGRLYLIHDTASLTVMVFN